LCQSDVTIERDTAPACTASGASEVQFPSKSEFDILCPASAARIRDVFTTMSELTPETLFESFARDLAEAKNSSELEQVRRDHLGRKSPLKAVMKQLRELPDNERRDVASRLNAVRERIESELESAIHSISRAEIAERLASEWQDLTMPGRVPPRGGRHPVTEVEERVMSVLRQLGFERVDGMEVETAYYNFDSLNIPEHHPARDMQDTFWLDKNVLLRTHTTSVQARVLAGRPSLPIKIASAGRVYRNEAVDATHLAMFHQFEGLWVDRNLSFAHLKGVLSFVAKSLFGDRPIRFKPKFYPYTEPSAGVDIECGSCHGRGCPACHGAGWITILGSGMVHPKVFAEFGYDAATTTGIAFGLGTTRMAAQSFGVKSVRSLYRPDTRVMRAVRRSRR